MAEKLAPRDVIGQALVDVGRADPNVLVCDADFNTASKIAPFKKQFPDRFIQMGIAEQNMMSVAAGLSMVGFTVYACAIAAFCSRRACDQVTVAIALTRANVKILGVYPGIFVGTNGASHQSMEDISIMRAIANMVVVHPTDAVETVEVVKYAARHKGPMYIRIGRDPVAQLLPDDYRFELGKAYTLREGRDVTIMTYGELAGDVLEAASMLAGQGVQARVLNMSSIKPIDEAAIVKAAEETGRIVTVDNHNIIGGMGSAVAEVVTDKCPVRVKRLGVRDMFGRSGKNDDMKRYHGLRAEDIAREVIEFIK